MPTNRRRRRVERRADVSALTRDQYRHLAFGRPIFSGAGFATREELLAGWRAHKDVILPLWLEAFPGCRPFAWWLSEGRERRALSAAEVRGWAADYPDSWGRCVPADDATLMRGWTREADAGDPAKPPTFGLLHTHMLPPIQEGELEYLERHGLLTKEEERALAAGEGHDLFSPEAPNLWTSHLAELYAEAG